MATLQTAFICVACGTQYPPSAEPPACCPVCDDERQFLTLGGQAWTDLPRLTRSHTIALRREGELTGVGLSPHFAIGQRALLVPGPTGNVLWDCVSYVDPLMVDVLKGLGGVSAIAISHPHYYSTMLEWSRAFGGIPIHLHARDREWVQYDGPELAFWEGETKTLAEGLTLIRCGGHFEGGTVLHWAQGARGRGAMLSGDILQVGYDRKTLGFMRSYVNFIPLSAAAVQKIAAIVAPWSFEALYGAFWDRVLLSDAEKTFRQSIDRHLHWLARAAD